MFALHVVVAVVLVVVFVICACLMAVVLDDMTRHQNRHKELRAELTDIERELDSYGPLPTFEQMERIDVRLDAYRRRFAFFEGGRNGGH